METKRAVWAAMRRRLGDEYLQTHAKFLEAQWEFAKEMRMVDDRGGSTIEYATIALVIVLVLLIGVAVLGIEVSSLVQRIAPAFGR